MVAADRKPSDILTRGGVLQCHSCSIRRFGGSTNAPIHLNAWRVTLGVTLALDDWKVRARHPVAGESPAGG